MFRCWPELPHARVGSLIGYIRRFRRPQTQKSVTYKSRDLERPQTFRNQINVKIRLEEIHRFASRTACDAILLKPTMAFILCQPLTWTRLSCPGIPHGQLWSRRLSVQLITCETSHTAHQVLYIYIGISHVTDVDFHLTGHCSSDFMYPRCSHAPSPNKHIEHVHPISLDDRPNHLQYCSRFGVSGLSELGQP